MSDDQKRLKRDEVTYEDIISGLPKHVIDNILKRLPLKDAVRTSILSRKWRNLWSLMTILAFDKEFFETNFINKQNAAYAYTILIYSTLMLRTEPIHKFCLYIPNLYWDWNVNIDKWLQCIISRNNINELELHNYNLSLPLYKLPSHVFSCPNLEVLKVTNCLFKPPSEKVEFAKLRILIFISMSFAPEACRDFILVLPVLRRLCFEGCRMIENLKVSAGNVSSFCAYNCYDVKSVSFDEFPNLEEVSIPFGKDHDTGRCGSFSLNEFLKKLPNVWYLRLNGAWLKVSAATVLQGKLPFMLRHLTDLDISPLLFDDLDQIFGFLCLLRSLPSLKKLSILAFSFEGTALESVSNHLKAPDCLNEMLNLQTVNFTSIKCSRPVLLLVECILARSPSLCSLTFEYIFDKLAALKVFKELLRFRRASSKAEVIFSFKELSSTEWAHQI